MLNATPAQHVDHSANSIEDIKASLRRRLVEAPSASDTPAAQERAREVISDKSFPALARMAISSTLFFHLVNNGLFDEASHVFEGLSDLVESDRRFGLDVDYHRAVLLSRSGQVQEAIDLLDSMHVEAQAETYPLVRKRITGLLASLTESVGDIRRAERLYEETFTLRQLHGNDREIAVAAFNYGQFLWRQGLPDLAVEYYQRAAAIERSLHNHCGLAQTLSNLAVAYAAQQSFEKAQNSCTEAQQLITDIDAAIVCVAVHINCAIVAATMDDSERQRSLLLTAFEIAEHNDFVSQKISLRIQLAELATKDSQPTVTESYLTEALGLCLSSKDAYNEAQVRLRLGQAKALSGQFKESREHLVQALELFTSLNANAERGDALELISSISLEEGATKESVAQLLESVKAYRRAAAKRERSKVDVLLARMDAERTKRDEEIHRLRSVELTEANGRLGELNRELMELANEKDEFLAIAAHDLRNPLFEMRAALSTIVQHVHELPPNDVRTMCRELLTAVTRMMSTVTTFLTMSQSGTQSAHLANERVNLDFLARRASERHAPRARAKGVSVTVDSPGERWAIGDPNLIDAILDNLLSNAIKYTEPNTSVEVVVSPVSTCIQIRDAGPGIPSSEVGRLFNKYPNISNRPSNGDESLGLGLYLAQRMAQRIGAHIAYHPREGRLGSSFDLCMRDLDQTEVDV